MPGPPYGFGVQYTLLKGHGERGNERGSERERERDIYIYLCTPVRGLTRHYMGGIEGYIGFRVYTPP